MFIQINDNIIIKNKCLPICINIMIYRVSDPCISWWVENALNKSLATMRIN